MTKNTPELQTQRLILRRFAADDAEAFYGIMRDEEVNRFLPLFPPKNIREASDYLHDRYIKSYENPEGFRYAISLKPDPIVIGYVNVSDGDSYDLGYGLKKDFWHKGIVTEACRALIAQMKRAGVPYITATHDIENPRSGNVMKKIGMTYQYTYEELWMPKNKLVKFRMYQLNLDGQERPAYKKYWDMYPVHFIEKDV